MASITVLSVYSNSVTVMITGLQLPQNTYSGFRVGVANGWTYSIPVTSSTGDSTSFAILSGLTGGMTYVIQGDALHSGTWWAVTPAVVTTPRARPSDWYWYTSKVSGGNFNITANEWNSFLIRINEFRSYKGFSAYPFTYASTGGNFTANHYNEARNAIYSITSNIPPWRNSGDIIYASDIEHLRIAINSTW